MVFRRWDESGPSGVLAEESPLVARSGATQQRRRADDADLRRFVEAHGVEVVVMPGFGGRPVSCPADSERPAIWSDRVGGVLREIVAMTDGPRPHRARAVHVDTAPTGRSSRTSLEGLDVQELTSARSGSKGGTSFGMYTIGMARLHRELARKRGAAPVTTRILATTTDPTVLACASISVSSSKSLIEHQHRRRPPPPVEQWRPIEQWWRSG